MKTLPRQLITSLCLIVIATVMTLVSTRSANAQADPGETAYQAQGFFDHLPGTTFEHFWVPAGTRLVIEHLEVDITVPHNSQPALLALNTLGLQTSVNGAMVGHAIGIPKLVFTSATVDNYLLLVDGPFYADHRPDLFSDFMVTWHATSNVTGNQVGAAVSGHLVCPRTLTCAGAVVGTGDGPPPSTAPSDVSVTGTTRPRFARMSKPDAVVALIER